MTTNQSQHDPSPWWHRFFDDTYASFGFVGKQAAPIDPIVDFLIEQLALTPGQTVFDQCCGIGRLSLPLARRGIQVIGVDLIPSYIDMARAAAKAENLPCEFHCGDAYEFVPPKPGACDAAFNWFTSFGYSDDDDVNSRMLQRAFESLKPGGRFVLDYLNMPMILANPRPQRVERADPDDPGSLLVLTEDSYDFARGMIDSIWTFIHPDGRREQRPVSTRLFMPHEIVGLFRRAGFVEIGLFGWIDGAPLTRQSRRCITLGRKPSPA